MVCKVEHRFKLPKIYENASFCWHFCFCVMLTSMVCDDTIISLIVRLGCYSTRTLTDDEYQEVVRNDKWQNGYFIVEDGDFGNVSRTQVAVSVRRTPKTRYVCTKTEHHVCFVATFE